VGVWAFRERYGGSIFAILVVLFEARRFPSLGRFCRERELQGRRRPAIVTVGLPQSPGAK
jgi:hypothetical protein